MDKKAIIKEIKNVNVKEKISVGQDFAQSKLMYGVKFGDNSYLMTSDREIFKMEDVEENLNLIPKRKNVEVSKINSLTVENFIEDNMEKYLNPQELFLSIKDNLKKYVFFDDDKNHDVITLWIILSYMYKMFTHVPYIHLKGDKGAGKSTVLSILNNLCFNATMWSSMTEAVIFRYVDVSNATLLLDEVENLKSPKSIKINSILNGGFNKEGKVARTMMNKNEERVVDYYTFSLKALAGINDIPNILKDRCISINMTKKPKSIKLERYMNISEDIIKRNDILVQNLYVFALKNCKEIYNLYKTVKVDLPECLSARDIDMYLPLFCIAKFIDANSENLNITETLSKYAEEMSKRRSEQDIEENLSYKLINDLYYMVTQRKVKQYEECYLNEEVKDYLNKNCNYFFSNTTALTKALKNLQIYTTRKQKGSIKNTYYIIKLKHLRELIDRYNIFVEENESLVKAD